MWNVLVRAWLLCLALTILIHPSHQQLPGEMKMDKLVTKDDGTIDICVTSQHVEATGYVLIYNVDKIEHNVFATAPDSSTAPYCITFTVDITGWPGKPVTLLLNAVKEGTGTPDDDAVVLDTSQAETIDPFPDLFDALVIENAGDEALRFVVGEVTLYDEDEKELDTVQNDDGSIQYLLKPQLTLPRALWMPTSVTQCSGTFKICDTPVQTSTASMINNEGPTLTEVTLHYSDGTISILSSPAFEATDLEVIIESASGTASFHTGKVDGSESTLTPPVVDPYPPSTEELTLNIFGVKIDTGSPSVLTEYKITTLKDCNLQGFPIATNILEVEWHHNGDNDYYSLTRVGGIGSDKISVECALTTCFGYFMDVGTNDQLVTLSPAILNEPENTVEGDPTQQIESMTIPMSAPFPSKLDIRANEIYMKWNSDGVSCQVSVCVQASVEKDHNLEYYQMVMLDSHGHHSRVQGASSPSPDTLCFSDLTLDSNTFDLNERVTVIFNRRDESGRAVLSSDQIKTFLIAPKVEAVTRNSGKVSWSNPGHYTFTVTRPHLATPLVSNLTCSSTCNHFFTVGSEKQEDRLLVASEDSTVRITAEIPVPLSTSTGM